MTNQIPPHSKAGGASGAIIVNIVDGDLCHAELVEDALAASGVAVAVACYTLVDVVVVDLGIEHCLYAGFETELGVVDFAARFDEFGHTHAEDIAWFIAFDDHGCGDVYS